MNVSISINHKSYLRDPESSELGKKIISESIKLMDKLGFEQFTFKKLASEIGSTEASVYRYFENKHKLLVYLVSWYWAWLDYHVTFQTHNLHSPEERLNRVIDVIAAPRSNDSGMPHINEPTLHRIVMAEASKVYLTKEVDAENKEGYFMEYKKLCRRIAEIILEINPGFPYPHALTSTMLEMAHRQVFFAQHLPSLTEITGSRRAGQETVKFLKHLVFSAINANQQEYGAA